MCWKKSFTTTVSVKEAMVRKIMQFDGNPSMGGCCSGNGLQTAIQIVLHNTDYLSFNFTGGLQAENTHTCRAGL